jgi:hypothetical protein
MMNCDGQVMNCGGQVMNCGGQVMMSCGGQVAVSQNARGFFRGETVDRSSAAGVNTRRAKCQLGIPNQELATVMFKKCKNKKIF